MANKGDHSRGSPKRGDFDDPLRTPSLQFLEGDDTQIGSDDPGFDDYELIKRIGEGGFGDVYEAMQRRPVRRPVAIKILKHGVDTREVVARFRNEQQTLAMMDHPGIATVYNAGETDDRLPYFAMELVSDSCPITDYCDQRKLTTNERLELFIEVCDAINHAHQKAVIHRDIKPSNILVADENGKPKLKVIDFGIAKALDSDLIDQSLHTRLGATPGTPFYMSPEQAAGKRITDIRSDIYPLGVLLFELLTGCHPLGPSDALPRDHEAMKRIIQERDPRRPSTALGSELPDRRDELSAVRGIDPNEIRRLLTNDLDWIILKSLDRDPEKRYATASAFAEDIQRHLNGELPLVAPPGTTLRLRKFVKRNKVPLAIGSMIAALLVAGTVVSLWFAVEARRALRKTQIQRGTAFFEANNLSAALLPWVEVLKQVDDDSELGPVNRLRVASTLERCPRLVGFWTHPSTATAAVFHPEGTIAAAFEDGLVQLYELGKPDPVAEFKKHSEAVRSVDFGGSGTRIASAGDDGWVHVYDSANPAKEPQHLEHPSQVHQVKFDSSGGRLASACDDGIARLWDPNEAAVIAKFEHGAGGGILDVAASPNGRLFATASKDFSAGIWDIASSMRLRTLRHGSWVYSVDFDHDGGKLVTASFDRTARIFDARDGSLLHILNHPMPVRHAEFSPDGRYVVTAGSDSAVRIWDVESGRETSTPLRHESYPASAAFSAEGHQIVTATVGGVVRVWDLASTHTSFEYSHLQYLPDGKSYVTVEDRVVSVFDGVTSTRRRRPINLNVAFNPEETLVKALGRATDGPLVLVTKLGSDHRFRLRIVRPDGSARAIPDSTAPIAISSDGTKFATCDDRRLTLHHRDVSPSSDLPPFGDTIKRVAFNPARSTQLAVGTGRGAWLCDDSGCHRIPVHNGDGNAQDELEIAHLEFSPDGRLLAITRFDHDYHPGDAQIWRTADRKRKGNVLWHRDGVLHATFNVIGTKVVTSSEDKTTRIWSLNHHGDWETDLVLPHPSDVMWADLSSDGKLVATVTREGSVRVWKTRDGDPITPTIQGVWKHQDVRRQARFVNGVAGVYVGRETGIGTVIPLDPTDESVEDLALIAQLLHGHRIDQSGTLLPLSREQLREKWNTLLRSSSKHFTTGEQARLRWHLREASAARSTRHWDAALFHLDWALEQNPDDESITRMIADVKERRTASTKKESNES